MSDNYWRVMIDCDCIVVLLFCDSLSLIVFL